MKIRTFAGFTRFIYNNGTVIDEFPSRLEITMGDRTFTAIPEDNPEYELRAKELGFATSLEMCKAHDKMHAGFADQLGLPYSPALLAASKGEPINELTGAEEAFILAFHKFVNLLIKEGLFRK